MVDVSIIEKLKREILDIKDKLDRDAEYLSLSLLACFLKEHV